MNKEKPKKEIINQADKIIFYRESFIQSFLADTYNFCFLFLLIFINLKFLGQRWYWDFLALFLVLTRFVAYKSTEIFTSWTELREYIELKELEEVIDELDDKVNKCLKQKKEGVINERKKM